MFTFDQEGILMNKKGWVLMLFVMSVAVNAIAVDYPKPTSWVNDYASVLSSDQRQELDSILKDFETATTNQIFVCIMQNLPTEITLEEYVNELFERWQPGQKDKDNGVLLAIFIRDRKLRIEVGYGLEEKLTDAASKLIVANDITPSFKQGDYYSGIRNGLQHIILTLHKEYQFPAPTKRPVPRSPQNQIDPMFVFFVIVFVVLPIIFRIMRGGRSYGWSSSRRGWRRHRRTSVGPFIIFGGGSRRSRRKSSGWGGGSSFGGFSGGGGGSSGGGGASGSW
jgi:uncharacterized protein